MAQQEWFLTKFREWEASTGRKQTEAAFAKFLHLKPPTLNRWMTGSATPTGENLRMLARRLGSEIYTIVGQPIPADLYLTDEQLAPLAELILSLPEHKRKHFRESLVNYAVDLARQIIDDP